MHHAKKLIQRVLLVEGTCKLEDPRKLYIGEELKRNFKDYDYLRELQGI